jgi:plasmid maintenance system killer protein
MKAFAEKRLEELFANGFSSRVPKRIERRVFRSLHIVVAAHELRDTTIAGELIQSLKHPGRPAIRVDDKWVLSFLWDDETGAKEIRLERW